MLSFPFWSPRRERCNAFSRSKLTGIRYWHRSFFMAGFKSLKYGCVIASSADSRRAGLHTNNLCKLIKYCYTLLIVIQGSTYAKKRATCKRRIFGGMFSKSHFSFCVVARFSFTALTGFSTPRILNRHFETVSLYSCMSYYIA